MPAFLAPLIGTGISALAGLFGNKKSARTSTQTNTSTSSSSSTPTLDPAYKPLQDMILPSITKRLSRGSALPEGYLEGGIHNINKTYDLAKQSLDNDLTSRGLGTSPVAGHAFSVYNRGRAGDIAGFLNKAPQIEREMENEDLEMAMRALGFGRGTQTTGTSTGTGAGTGAGSALGGAIDNMSSTLGWLIGSGAFGGAKKSLLPNKMNPMDFLQGFK